MKVARNRFVYCTKYESLEFEKGDPIPDEIADHWWVDLNSKEPDVEVEPVLVNESWYQDQVDISPPKVVVVLEGEAPVKVEPIVEAVVEVEAIVAEPIVEAQPIVKAINLRPNPNRKY